MQAAIVHVMVRVLDFERTKRFYAPLGLREIDRYAFGDFRVCYLADDRGMQIELIENIGRTEPYSHGDGFGNVAFSIADAEETRAALIAAGAEPGVVKDIVFEGRLFARYFHAVDPDGYRIEVMERRGRWASVPPVPLSS